MRQIWLKLLFLNFLGLLLFFKGFFPFKSQQQNVQHNDTNLGNPTVTKFVFIVIDALRVDMIYNNKSDSTIPQLNKLMKKGFVDCSITHLQAPTVTMPRIKALTTGSIPGFIDVLLNFDSRELLQDNLITRLSTSGWRLVLAGDDTWLKLFPHGFSRAFPTTSFFVTDFTEVDVNVTRELDGLLPRGSAGVEEWDGLVLHYLGLDHIGHVEGPTSWRVPGKLREMDDVIGRIVDSLKTSSEPSWAVFISGDHGMSDYGGHGGASHSETTTPFLAIRNIQNHNLEFSAQSCAGPKTVEQIDMATTLSLLTNVGIPSASYGVINEQLLSWLPGWRGQLDVVLKNAEHLVRLAVLNSEEEFQYNLLKTITAGLYNSCPSTIATDSLTCHADAVAHIGQWLRLLRRVQDRTAQSITEYNLFSMILGVSTLWMIVTVAVVVLACKNDLLDKLYSGSLNGFFYLVLGILSFMGGLHILFTMWESGGKEALFWSGIGVLLVAHIAAVVWSVVLHIVDSDWRATFDFSAAGKMTPSVFLIGGSLLQAVSLSSSSLVEEEHQAWYYLVTSFHLLLFALSIRTLAHQGPVFGSTPRWCTTACLAAVLFIDRFLRTLNQTGDKWSHLPDLSDWLTSLDNSKLLDLLVIACYASVVLLMCSEVTPLSAITSGLCVLFQISLRRSHHSTILSTVHLAQLCYVAILFDFLVNISQRRMSSLKVIFRSVIFLILVLCKPVNLVLWILTLVKERLVHTYLKDNSYSIWTRKGDSESVEITAATITFWCGMTTFFQLGNSHSISTVDVASGYIGLSDYQPVIASFLMAVNTFSGPIFWLLSLSSHISQYKPSERWPLVLILHLAFPTAIFTSVCLLLRYHLFVWTVFSPKLLYFGLHFVLQAFLLILTKIPI